MRWGQALEHWPQETPDHHEDPPLGSSLTTCDLVSHALRPNPAPLKDQRKGTRGGDLLTARHKGSQTGRQAARRENMPCPPAPGPAGQARAARRSPPARGARGQEAQVGRQDHRATFVQQGAANTGFQRSTTDNRPVSARSHKNSLTCTNAGQAKVARGGVEPPTFRFSGGVAVRLRHVVQTRYRVGGAWAAPSRRRMDWSCTGPVRNAQTSAGRHPMVRADWPVTARALLPPASGARRTRWGHARMP